MLRLSLLSWLRSYPITVFFMIIFAILIIAILTGIFVIAGFGIEKEIMQKTQDVEYKMMRFINTFKSSDGQQFLGNLAHGNLIDMFDKMKRPFTPIYLPKRKWVDLPSLPNLHIEDIPQSCMMQLMNSNDKHDDDIITACAYVTDGIKIKGVYLYLYLSFVENNLISHKPGSLFNTDYATLSIMRKATANNWRIVFRKTKSPNLYDAVAFPVNHDGTITLSSPHREEFSGWAERSKINNAHKMTTNLFLRIAYRVVDPNIIQMKIDDLDKVWPPNDLDLIKIELSRNDIDELGGHEKLIAFEKEGKAMFSLPALYKEYGLENDDTIILTRFNEYNKIDKTLTYPPKKLIPSKYEFYEKIFNVFVKNHQTSSIISHEKNIINQPFRFRLERYTEIGTELRKIVLFWGLCIFFAVVIVGLALWWLVFRNINRLAVNANRLATDPLGSSDQLAKEDKRTEIGMLTRAFNSVLHKAREQAIKLKDEQVRRENNLRQRYDEEITRREELLNTVGHDIRSPLQLLLAIHPHGSEYRRPVERILRAVKRLYGEVDPEDSYAIEPLNLSKIDIADFVKVFVSNKKKTFADLEYIGPENGVVVNTEDIALEEVLDQIVCNAESFHAHGTRVTIELSYDAGNVIIAIKNLGPSIPSDSLEKIFNLGVSIREKSPESKHRGQGLYMALGYIKKMGGFIVAKNIHDGVVFEISLPLFVQY